MTKEQKTQANREWAANRKQALNTVLEYLRSEQANDPGKLPEAVIEAIKIYSKKRGGGKRGGLKSQVLEFFSENKTIHEDDLFFKFKLGRSEARTMFNSFLKGEPEERIWISLDKDTGTYTVVGEGKDAPEDWDGYLPTDLKNEVKSEDEELIEDEDYDEEDTKVDF